MTPAKNTVMRRAFGHGGYYVADTAGNDRVHVGANGQRRTVAVLPSQPVEGTLELITQFGFDACLIGRTHYAEPVPTVGGFDW